MAVPGPDNIRKYITLPLLRWSIKTRSILARPAETVPPYPLLESQSFWGAIGVATMLLGLFLSWALKDFKWALGLSWPFWCWAIGIAAKHIKANSVIRKVFLMLSSIVIGGILLAIGNRYTPKPEPKINIASEKQAPTPDTVQYDTKPQVSDPAKRIIITTASSKKRELVTAIAECRLPPNESMCEMICDIANQSSAAVRDIALGFMGSLPTMTRVSAPPDFRLKMEISETLPIPDPDGNVDSSITAMSISIPMLPPSSKVRFQLWTDDENNKKACAQEILLQQKAASVLRLFFDALKSDRPDIELPNITEMLSASARRGAL